jgi:ribosomal protein S4E
MGSIAGSKKLKRQMAPTFWGINRKDKRFVITVRPGSHPKSNSIPSAVLLRDTIKKVKTLREAKSSIYSGKIKVDGIIQKSLHHSIGLMDVVELEGTTDVYRLIPEQKILDVIKFEKDSQVIVTRGINAGRIGIINEIKQGTFTLPKRINLLIDDNTVEIPANITMVVGKEKPLIQIR